MPVVPEVASVRALLADRADLLLATLVAVVAEALGVEVLRAQLLVQVVDVLEGLVVVGLGELAAERGVGVGLLAVEVRVVGLGVVRVGRAFVLLVVPVSVVLLGLVGRGLTVLRRVERMVRVIALLGLAVIQLGVLVRSEER